MTRNGHVRFGERSRETRSSRGEKVRSAPTLFSPLLMNVALHGMETAIRETTYREGKPIVVRYADDFVLLHPNKDELHIGRGNPLSCDTLMTLCCSIPTRTNCKRQPR